MLMFGVKCLNHRFGLEFAAIYYYLSRFTFKLFAIAFSKRESRYPP